MSRGPKTPFFLLSYFAEFYEAVAGIKQAIHEGRLSATLKIGDQAAPTSAADIAASVSGQLATILRRQSAKVQRECSADEIRAYHAAQYAMAALADEIFVLELDWVGQRAWIEVLLEYKLFKSHLAGKRVFTLIEKLLAQHLRGPLHVDLACVLLIVLQLGFKGQYRGQLGERILHDLRAQLFAIVAQGHTFDHHRPAFPQAYEHLAMRSKAARIAPLRPWLLGTAIVLVIYTAISTVVWLYMVWPFITAMGMPS